MTTTLLVPGAWMGAWIWEDMVERLRSAGHHAHTLTLSGLEASTPSSVAAEVSLEQHVDDVMQALGAVDDEVVLVGHSYSGAVVGLVADRLLAAGARHGAPIPRLRRVIHVASFLPRTDRSLLDDWGDDVEAREAEKAQVRADGMLWNPPPGAALAEIGDLTEAQAKWLGDRFVAHPGRTVLDPARLARPVSEQVSTFIATAPAGQDPRADLPPELGRAAADLPQRWRVRTLESGHWPMLSVPEELFDLLDGEIRSTAA